MGKYIFLLLCGIALIAFVFFGSRLLCIYVRKPLVEYCKKRGLSASPWLILISMGTGIYLLNKHIPSYEVENISDIVSSLSKVKTASDMINCYGGIALLVLPLLIFLIRARKYFIPVLLIKIACIPMDIFYLVHAALSKDNLAEGAPAARADYQNNRQYRQASGGQDGYVNGDSYNAGGYVEEKYRDQYRASQEGDSYHRASSGDGERYYTGDYVPFVSEGEVTEVRTYDSDYAPMD